jgi:hypothetical protein
VALAPKENTMKRLLIATTLIAAFATPVFAAEFYVMYEMDSKKCVTMKTMPSDMKKYKMLGKYPTQGEAETAMHTMTECK